MKQYFTYLLNLTYYIKIKEKEIIDLKERIKEINNKKMFCLNKLMKKNVKISELSLIEEERETEFIFSFFPIMLLFFFLIMLILSISTKIFTMKFLYLIVPIILSFPICNLLKKIAKIKYAKIRLERREEIQEHQRETELLADKCTKLNKEEECLFENIKNVEEDIKEKREKIEGIRAKIIKEYATLLDKLIIDEIANNNIPELQDVLNRVREI